MTRNGFRSDEPVTVAEVILESDENDSGSVIPFRVIGGNHRCAAARWSGLTLIWAYVIPKKHLVLLYESLHRLDKLQDRNCSLRERWERVLRKLTVLCQTREPAPRPTLVLEQVAMIRTYNDSEFKPIFDASNKIMFGNAARLRMTMFNAHKEQNVGIDETSNIHFMLNRTHSTRHANK